MPPRLIRKVEPILTLRALVLDTETNGQDPQEIIELAYIDLKTEKSYCQRFKPSVESNAAALSVHHILPEELEGCEPSSNAKIPKDVGYLIGHNIDFDWEALGKPPVKRICTLAIARSLYPTLSAHRLGAMLYTLLGATSGVRERLKNAHNALADVGFCLDILQVMLSSIDRLDLLDDPEALWEFSEECRLPKVMTFGKHKGTAVEDLPLDYVKWMLRQDSMDPYGLQAVRNAYRL